MTLEEKNVFVTGANGFVGSWLTEALVRKKSNVVALLLEDNPKSNLVLCGMDKKIKIVYGNLIDYEKIKKIFEDHEIDTCFHLAAQAIVGIANQTPLPTFESNIKGTWNILEAARNCKTVERVIIASSDKAYGDGEKLPYTEDSPLKASHPYDVSKACADMLALSYHKTYGLPVGVTRCANIYGGGDLNFSRVVPGTIKSVLFDEEPVIRSDGTPLRDYIYVLDAVDAYLTLAENLEKVRGEAFNFGANKPVSVLQMVEKILSLSGKTRLRSKILNTAKGEIKDQYLSSKKADKMLGWKPRYDLDSGLKETIAWYSNFFGI